MDWTEHFAREEERYRDGQARLPDVDDPDARQKQLTRMGNAAGGAGLALLMQGRDAGPARHPLALRRQTPYFETSTTR